MRMAVLAVAAAMSISCTRVDESSVKSQALPMTTTPGGIEQVLIPAGEFSMGSATGHDDEMPLHELRMDSFYIDRYEVNQEHYKKLMEINPSRIKSAKHPVENVTWVLAALYCNARSEADGLAPCYNEETAECDFSKDGYRLPTEAEWEYACRAGTNSDFSFGNRERQIREYAWFADNAAKKTHPVGLKKPNPWGLYDMHGNVAEWTNDIYDKTYYEKSPAENPRGPAEGKQYVVRGGSWQGGADVLRSAARVAENPGFTDACLAPDTLGFRCVRRAPKPAEEKTVKKAEKESSSLPTGFLYGEIYLQHRTGEGFPERPERLEAVVKGLKDAGLLTELTPVNPVAAPTEWITTVHSTAHVKRVRKACEKLGSSIGHLDSGDVPICSQSYEVALAAAGGVLAAVDAVMDGKIRNAFCAVRPPGHHARQDQAMGFCLFNNVAIAARYILRKHKLSKVLIVDWDVHHGNATQETFYSDPSVLFFSTHLHPFYPMTGDGELTGEGEGRGTNINVVLQAGDGDEEVKKAFAEELTPAALKFRPDFVLISCGFDAHANDLLGRLEITSSGFAELTRIVKKIAEKCCRGRLVSVLEGGYRLDNLATASAAHVRALME